MKNLLSLKHAFLATALAAALPTLAGVPLNNLEGVGGVAFNPLAYTAGQNADKDSATNGFESLFSKPQAGAWYAHLGKDNINWGTFGVADTIANRLEVSYGYELIRLGPQAALAQPDDKDISKHNLGAKLLAIRENEGGYNFIPAVAVGSIWKTTDYNVVGPNRAGFDYYAVATKLITQTPLPVLVSGGLLDTDEEVTGVLGHNKDHDLTWFGNIDVLPTAFLATGFEYKQGATFDNGVKNANYWDAHVAWFVNPHLTVVGAYAYTGHDYTDSNRIGLGGGVVLSAQYAF